MQVRAFRQLIVMIAVLAAAGCAQKVRVPVQLPAASVDAMHLRTVSVAQFDGDPYGIVADTVESFLTQIRVDHRPWFTVIQPRSGERVSPRVAGRMSSAPDFAVYSGQVTEWDMPSEYYTDTEEVCVLRDKRKCLQWETRTIPCLKRSAAFGAIVRVASVQTGQVVFSVYIDGAAKDSGCGDGIAYVDPEVELMGTAMARAFVKLDCQFAPCVVMRDLELMSETDGLSTKEAKARFKAAYDYAIEAQGAGFKVACSEWIKLATVQMEETVPLFFNVAACHEVNGEFDQAMDYLNRAKTMHVGINPEIEDAIANIHQAQIRSEVVKQQMRRAGPGS